MKINKYTKLRDNRYKVYFDDIEVVIYDDIILEFGLLTKKEIDIDTFNKMNDANDLLKYYYMCVKYINRRLRSEKEIREYLYKYIKDYKVINDIVKKLYKNNWLNDELFTRAYVLDAINLGNDGKRKIEKKLLTYGVNKEYIDNELSKIDEDVFREKADRYIAKKIKFNHNSSKYQLINKIKVDLINLGYDKEMIESLISNYDIIDDDIQKKEYEKAKKALSRKYEGKELERKIRERLYRKGFRNIIMGDDDYVE